MSKKFSPIEDELNAFDPLMEKYKTEKQEYEIIRELEETKDKEKNKRHKGFSKIISGTKKFFKKVTFFQGYQDRKSAKNIKEGCANLYQAATKVTESKRKKLNKLITSFGKYRLEALQRTEGKFLAFLEDMNQKNKQIEYEILDGIGLNLETIEQMRNTEMSISKLMTNTAITSALGAAAAMGTPALITGLVGTLGTASTGTAISSLSGAAASNAILAWLGGGSLAVGGGGMAAGATALTVITGAVTGGVALLTALFFASTHYSKKLTESKKYQKDVEVAVAEMEKAWVLIDGIGKRTRELSSVTSELEDRTMIQLEYMEPLTIDFDTEDMYYNKVFQKTGLLVKAMSELAKTPLLDNDGNISDESAQIITKTYTILNTELINHE